MACGILGLVLDMWDLSSLIRDVNLNLKVEARSANHWTTRKVPINTIFLKAKNKQKNDLKMYFSFEHYPLSATFF